LELVIAGVTGRATEAMGRFLTRRSSDFWPPYAEKKGRRLGVYICHFKLTQGSQDPNAKVYADGMRITPIAKEVLEKYMS
jgi:hypothetical protein